MKRALFGLALAATGLCSQDEIQVYEYETVPKGIIGLGATWHEPGGSLRPSRLPKTLRCEAAERAMP